MSVPAGQVARAVFAKIDIMSSLMIRNVWHVAEGKDLSGGEEVGMIRLNPSRPI